MRKLVSIIAALCIVATTLFAVSYTNNTYHKLAEEYTDKAQKALDAGFYELAEEYAAEAKKNAALSEEFIARMLAKSEAEEAIEKAQARVDYALEQGVDKSAKEYTDAVGYLDKAKSEYDNEEYPEAKSDAEKVSTILSDAYLSKVSAENAAKNEARDALAKAKEALDAAEETGVPTDSESYKTAKDYYDQAQKDFDDGDYESAKENAQKAIDALDDEDVKKLLAKKDAENALKKAKEALDKAQEAGIADSPLYKDALAAYEDAQRDYVEEKYPESIENSNKVLDLLSDDNVNALLEEEKKAAEDAIAKAKEILDQAQADGIDTDSEAYKQALDCYNKAVEEYDNKDYKAAKEDAEKVGGILTDDLLSGLNKEKAASDAIAKAKERLDYAEAAGLDENDENYKAASDYYKQAVEDYSNGKYDEAKDNAKQVLELLPVDYIDGVKDGKKAAAEEALAKAKAALDNAKDSGLSPLTDEYNEAVELYAAAKDAYENGDYDSAKEKADKVLELLDPETVKNMKAKADAEAALSKARERITAAYAAGLDEGYDIYREALAYYREAQKNYADEDYASTKENADKVVELLSDEAIDEILDQAEADKIKSLAEGALTQAKERLDYAESLGLDASDEKFNSALAYYNRALDEFADADYAECIDDAEKVLDILADSYLNSLIARGEAEKAIAAAKERLDYAESINAARDFPIAFDAAKAYYSQALDDYNAEQYEKAIADANKVIDALADVHEMTVLPKFYIVRPWAESKDCFWNISGRSYVYNNPWLWENLYEANKDNIPERDNPNLILPGMKMEIPSISGEYRDGVYSPDVEYGTFNANR